MRRYEVFVTRVVLRALYEGMHQRAFSLGFWLYGVQVGVPSGTAWGHGSLHVYRTQKIEFGEAKQYPG